MTSLAQKYLKMVPQYTRNSRHARAVMQHGTPRKWVNLARVEWERKKRRVEVKGNPYLLIIDPTNFCNLRCPLCPTGVKSLGREQSMMSLECFKHYFDPHVPYLFEVYLHNWGESLLNKQTYDMIEYAQSKNVGTNLSSNLSALDDEDLDRLIDSGLEYLVVSLDGASEETYKKYRVRGKFDRVMRNMRELIKRRNARGLVHPVVEWQFIVMRHNEHEVEEAERISEEYGVDIMRFIPVGLPYDFEDRKKLQKEWFPTNMQGRVEDAKHDEQTFGQGHKPGACFYLYRSMVVNSDGGVSPCCVVYQKDRDFAQLTTDSENDVNAIFNNERYKSARSLFSPQKVNGRCKTVCDGCDIFAVHPSKMDDVPEEPDEPDDKPAEKIPHIAASRRTA
ncbi:MAG: radical SAM/SPASM domain-containing protein [Paracoccaceae bacterium]